MKRETKIKAEEKFPISGQGYTLGKLLDNTECQILLDSCQNHFICDATVYMCCPNLSEVVNM